MSSPTTSLPFATADLPGTGGVLRTELEDFQVDELPAYEPQGTGDHVFCRVTKQNLSTLAAVERIADALNIHRNDIGAAGMKDKLAITTQMLSLPPPITPEQALALDLEGLKILSATRHGHKLRTGHLAGNRFTLVLRNLDVDSAAAVERATAILEQLSTSNGAPNWFGAQRFGRHGDNADIGLELVNKTASERRLPRGKKRRLFISALQSALFNQYLRERIEEGLYGRVLSGDILRKTDSGGMFECLDVAVDQERLERGELGITGPMFGHKMRAPSPNTDAAGREGRLLDAHQLSPASFAHLGKLATGTRRPLAIAVTDAAVSAAGERAIELSFSLPAGCYATSMIREIAKTSDFPN